MQSFEPLLAVALVGPEEIPLDAFDHAIRVVFVTAGCVASVADGKALIAFVVEGEIPVFERHEFACRDVAIIEEQRHGVRPFEGCSSSHWRFAPFLHDLHRFHSNSFVLSLFGVVRI